MALASDSDAPLDRGALARLLRTHRHRLVLTQEELARQAGVGVRTISDLERGANHSARLSTVRKLAAALRLSEVETQQMLRVARPGPAPTAPVDAEPTGRFLDAAAADAAGSWERSVSFYEAAMAEVTADPDPDLRDLADALLGFGRAATMGLRRHDARPALVRAARVALRLRDRDRLVEAAAWYSFMTKAGESGHEAGDLWQHALLLIDDDDLAGRSILVAARATVAVLDLLPESAPALAARSLDLARRSGDSDALAVALSAYVLATWGHPNPGERRALGEELEDVESPWFPHAALAGVEVQAVPALQLGDRAAFERCASTLAATATAAHHPYAAAQAELWCGASCLLRGDLAAAEAASHAAVASAGRAPNFTAAHVAQIFAIRRAEGREGELVDVVAAGLAAQPMELAWRAGLALAALAAGDVARAAEVVDRITGELWPPATTWTLPLTLAYLAEAAWRLGDAGLGGRVAEALVPYSDELVVMGTGSACEGAVSHHLGLAALARGERDEARRHLDRALAVHSALDAPVLVARTEAALAAT